MLTLEHCRNQAELSCWKPFITTLSLLFFEVKVKSKINSIRNKCRREKLILLVILGKSKGKRCIIDTWAEEERQTRWDLAGVYNTLFMIFGLLLSPYTSR